MADINEYIRAARGLNGWQLTRDPDVDDDLSKEIMAVMLSQGGEWRPSELSRTIFGDTGNCHCLAVEQRVVLLREAGLIVRVGDSKCIYTAPLSEVE